jgi:truncated hemoglobin YjbI
MATTPRRRLIRPDPSSGPPPSSASRQAQKLRARLEKERLALARWMKKFKRACTAVQKIQRTIARVERRLTPVEE